MVWILLYMESTEHHEGRRYIMKPKRDPVDRLEEAKSTIAFVRDCYSVLGGLEVLGELSLEGEQGIYWILENAHNQIEYAEVDLIKQSG
jgi:hypothetical protein